LPFDAAKTDGRTSIDSSGSIVSCRTNEPGEAVLLELATCKVLGTWSETEAKCEFPSQKYWRDSMTGYLFQKDNRTPLVNFDIVAETRADWFFSHAQTHVAWSSSEGTVSVANISAVQKRLAAVGLGW